VLGGFEVIYFVAIFVFVLFLIVEPLVIAFIAFHLDFGLKGIYIAEFIIYGILIVTWSIYYWLKIDVDELCKSLEIEKDLEEDEINKLVSEHNSQLKINLLNLKLST